LYCPAKERRDTENRSARDTRILPGTENPPWAFSQDTVVS